MAVAAGRGTREADGVDDPAHPSPSTRATSRLLLVPTVAGAVMGLWSRSLPAGAFFLAIGAMLTWLFAGVLWLVLAVIRALDGRKHRPSVVSIRSLVVAATLVASTGALSVADVPLRARWSVSRSAFEEVVADAATDPQAEPTVPDRLGAYRVSDVDRHGDATVFTIPTSGIFTTSGFAHLPEGPGTLAQDEMFGATFEHLGGDWYTWIVTD